MNTQEHAYTSTPAQPVGGVQQGPSDAAAKDNPAAAPVTTVANLAPTTIDGRTLPKRWLAAVATIWAGFALTSFTGMAASYAAVWFVTETTASPLMLALVYVCAFLPIGLLSPVAGVVADRYNRKLIVIVCDAFLALTALVCGLLVATGSASLGIVLVMVTLFGIEQAFRSPAFNAMMPLLVPEAQLMRINMLDSILGSVSMICAPALGILLYTNLGLQAVMFVDALGAALAALAMLCAQVPTVCSGSAKGRGIVSNLQEGWKTLAGDKGLLFLALGIILGMMAYAPIDSLLPLMVSAHFDGNGYMASLVTGVFGVGMLLGSVILMVRGGQSHLTRIIIGAALAVGTTTAFAGCLPSTLFCVFVAAMGIMAMACAGFGGPFMTILQHRVDADKLGRVMGLYSAFMGLCVPLGTALGGMLAEVIGVSGFFVVDGAVMLVLGIALASLKSVRALDGKPAQAQAQEG